MMVVKCGIGNSKMSSSEQAPEPTMDEILASIRKIISDDEPGSAAQPETASAEAGAQAADTPEAAAPEGDALADDLANALNDTQESAQATDDILDLTEVVEQHASAEAVEVSAPQPEAPSQPPQGEALQNALAGMGTEMAPEPAAEASGEKDISALLAEAGVEDTAGEGPAEPPPPPLATEAPAGDELSAILGNAEDMAATAPEAAPEGDASMAEDEFEAMTQQPPEMGAEGPQSFEAPAGIELPDVPLADVVADEVATETMADTPGTPEAAMEEALGDMAAETPQPAEEPSIVMPDDQPEMPAVEPEVSVEPEGFAGAEAVGLPGEELVAAAVTLDVVEAEPEQNTDASADEETPEALAADQESGKSLEASVKDMLRPLLREWLDDNMERIVKDEVASSGLKSDDS